MKIIDVFAIHQNRGHFRDDTLRFSLNNTEHAEEAVRVFSETVVAKRNDTNQMVSHLLNVLAEGTDKFLFSIGSRFGGNDSLVEFRAYIHRPLFTNDIDTDKVDFLLLNGMTPTNLCDGKKLNSDKIVHTLRSIAERQPHSPSVLVKDFGVISVTSNGTASMARGAKKTFDIRLKIEVSPDDVEIENGKLVHAYSHTTASFNPRDWYEDDWTGFEHPYTDQGVVDSINAHLRQLGFTKGVDWSEQGRQEFALLDFDTSYELLEEIWPELKKSKIKTAK